MNRCGVCNGPTMTGVICNPHWKELDGLLTQCSGIDSDLDAAVGKRLRFGERVRRGTAQGLLVSPAAVEAKTVLEQVLRGAGRALGLPVGDSSAGETADVLRVSGRWSLARRLLVCCVWWIVLGGVWLCVCRVRSVVGVRWCL